MHIFLVGRMVFPPDVPDTKGDEPFTLGGLLKGWFSIMVPAAVAAFIQTKSVFLSLGAMLATPAVAIVQGTLLILQYRYYFGDSPAPLAPAHGVVVVNPADASKDVEYRFGNLGCSCLGGQRWRRGGPLTEQERLIVQKASNGPPLRILVIGDSLAIGVGSTRSCTPLMPEVVARTLSKALGGRAVYWTAHGAAGASAQWVVRECQRGIHYLQPNHTISVSPKADASSSNNNTEHSSSTPLLELSDSSSEEDEDNSMTESEDSLALESISDVEEEEEEEEEQQGDGIDFADWKQRLRAHKKRFDPDVVGPYDITMVMVGPNDLKSAFFPFLLKGEDSKFRKQAQARGGSYDAELRRVLSVLEDRMHNQTEPFTPRQAEDATDKNKDKSNSTTQDASPNKHNHGKLRPRPLVVFPGMPAEVLPIFSLVPNRWLSIPCVGIMDNHKRALARANPEKVLFVEAPTKEHTEKFEDQRGPLWDQRVKEDTLLSVRITSKGECREIEGRMKQYYGTKGRCYGHEELYKREGELMCQFNPPEPKLSLRNGTPGQKVIGVDKIHPNDEGYDFWGRYIANNILTAWRE